MNHFNFFADNDFQFSGQMFLGIIETNKNGKTANTTEVRGGGGGKRLFNVVIIAYISV